MTSKCSRLKKNYYLCKSFLQTMTATTLSDPRFSHELLTITESKAFKNNAFGFIKNPKVLSPTISETLTRRSHADGASLLNKVASGQRIHRFNPIYTISYYVIPAI